MLTITDLAQYCSDRWAAAPSDVEESAAYAGLFSMPIWYKNMRAYLFAPDFDPVREGAKYKGEKLVMVRDGDRISDYSELIVLKNYLLVLRYYSPTGHKYKVYTPRDLRPLAPSMTFQDPPTGTPFIPPLGTNYVRLNADYEQYYSSLTDTFPDPVLARQEKGAKREKARH